MKELKKMTGVRSLKRTRRRRVRKSLPKKHLHHQSRTLPIKLQVVPVQILPGSKIFEFAFFLQRDLLRMLLVDQEANQRSVMVMKELK